MLIYSHNVPEILISRFFTKEDIKNDENFCGLVDENFPDDVTQLKGDALIIKEGPNTLNLDFALAICYNSITDCDSAVQFAKLLTVNGPKVDTSSLLFYIKKIQTGPFSYCVKQAMQAHFDLLIGTPAGPIDVLTRPVTNRRRKRPQNTSNIDNDFKNTLANLLKECLTAPCNYFNFTNSSYGFLARSATALNDDTLTVGLSSDFNNQGTGVYNYEAFVKSPYMFGKFILESSWNALVATYNAIKHFGDTLAQNVSAASNTSISKLKPSQLNRGTVARTDTISYNVRNQAASLMELTLSKQLGDCYRMYDYNKRYNPFDYSQNQKGGKPDGRIQPGLPTILTNETLNASTSGNISTQSQTTPILPQFALTKPAFFDYVSGDSILPTRLSPYLADSKERLFAFISKSVGDIQKAIQGFASGNKKLEWFEQFLLVKDGDLGLASDIESIATAAGAEPYDLLELKTTDGRYIYGRWTFTEGVANTVSAIYYQSITSQNQETILDIKVLQKAVNLIREIPGIPQRYASRLRNTTKRTGADVKVLNIPNYEAIPPGWEVSSTGVARIDFDGSGKYPANDTHQLTTSLTVNGQPLNGDQVPFVVANEGSGYKIGDIVYLFNSNTDKGVTAIIGDNGPKNEGKVEISPAAARALGVGGFEQPNGTYINSNDDHSIKIYTKSTK